jgi:MYXO-CTERM domain-containing protein
MLSSNRLRAVMALSCLVSLAAARDADACGGCFVSQSERSVVTDHRMALSVSKQQTVLWDQIRYQGDPRDFAWVLPVRKGARIELSHDEWFAALDASTQPTVSPPPGFMAGSAGCGLYGCSASASSAAGDPGSAVTVVGQKVVGPYETATLRSTDDGALVAWLRANGYAVPPSIEPTIGSYVREGFDFLALKLRPSCGVRAMEPVRIVTPGADPTLPLRMVAAGVGATVGLTLYVIGEGRWRPKNFPEARIDDAKLQWFLGQSRSNYAELAADAMEQNGGRTWLVEASERARLSGTGNVYASAQRPGLYDAYFAQCRGTWYGAEGSGGTGASAPGEPCVREDVDAGVEVDADADAGANADADADASASADVDASASADASADAQRDAGSMPPPFPSGDPCDAFDDLRVATEGMRSSNVWVTRLRANLPVAALAADLRLEAPSDQSVVSPDHVASTVVGSPPPTASTRRRGCSAVAGHEDASGTVALVAATVFGLSALRRRRRR